ncbi:HGR115Cp [Eremothecium sinecaudum]|uniref:Phosphotransferase n=1 Tax=Eremothecium sinecaudum TaxID=45286 RepID=A0A0X8HVU3_9SACH|nr:HGR115Cp [Eremothecium sinecaudum]AMD22454.1 HGR115Cp [Eremothecium sinecaudum]
MVHLGPKKPPARKGSMADVPRSMLEQINHFEKMFAVSGEKLKEIRDVFVSELQKGLNTEANIPMIPGWVMEYPTGQETGDFLAIDLGGTNLRVVLVQLLGNHKFDTTQSKYKIPEHLRTCSNGEELWEFIASSMKAFLDDQFPEGVKQTLPLGFTFSFPASQSRINEGILQRWTKGYDIPNVEGHDVVVMLQKAIEKLHIPIEVVALINDTTGTLVASLYTDAETKMGVIFGTGVNGAYYDVCSGIKKLDGKLPAGLEADTPMAINCEYGSFDNEHVVLPRNKYDIIIDEESPRPGQQSFEKMTSGYYLGELLRLVLMDLYEQGLIFQNTDVSKLKKPFIMDTSYPARIEDDPFENLSETDILLKNDLNLDTTLQERKLIRKLSEFIGTRSARLSVCGIAAVCQKRGYESAHIAADGSVYKKYPNFKERATAALRDLYDWKMEPSEYPIVIVPAEDGSGAGAAIIAALTKKRLAAGKPVGLA